MQKEQALHCNAEAPVATIYSRNSRRCTVIQKLQALNCNAKAVVATK
jgi:hypothetical protein